MFSPAADDIVALIQLLNNERNVLRIILQVGIHRNNDLSSRMLESGGQRRGLAEVAGKEKRLNSGISGSQFLDGVGASIQTAVIDEDNLGAESQGIQHRFEPLVEGIEVLLFVKNRDDDRKVELALSRCCSW